MKGHKVKDCVSEGHVFKDCGSKGHWFKDCGSKGHGCGSKCFKCIVRKPFYKLSSLEVTHFLCLLKVREIQEDVAETELEFHFVWIGHTKLETSTDMDDVIHIIIKTIYVTCRRESVGWFYVCAWEHHW